MGKEVERNMHKAEAKTTECLANIREFKEMHKQALSNLQTDENFEQIQRLNNQSKENSKLMKLIQQKFGFAPY